MSRRCGGYIAEARAKLTELKALGGNADTTPDEYFSLMEEIGGIRQNAVEEFDTLNGKPATSALGASVFQALEWEAYGILADAKEHGTMQKLRPDESRGGVRFLRFVKGQSKIFTRYSESSRWVHIVKILFLIFKFGREFHADIAPVPRLVDVVGIIFRVGEHKPICISIFREPEIRRRGIKLFKNGTKRNAGEINRGAELMFRVSLLCGKGIRSASIRDFVF